MERIEAIKHRHSVRNYTDQTIGPEVIIQLQSAIDQCNEESGLHIQLIANEPNAFGGFMARYGNFTNVKNYIALVGKKDDTLDETIGYYGERLVLLAAMLGLNSCWVGLTFSKGKATYHVEKGEILRCVIALGYGVTQGVPHKSKPLESLCTTHGDVPDWFRSGMEAVLLAPTAVNQQKFHFTLFGNTVKAVATGGFYSKVDLGIVKHHFEIGAGTENFEWIE